MKYITIILLAWLTTFQAGQNLYVCKNAKINLYSSAPIEDIKAETNTGVSVYNASTGELDFSVTISTFKFPKELMQEHFNSDYMESDKFHKATFKGKIQEQIDITKDGSYPITVDSDLTVHDVTQKRSKKSKVDVKGGATTMTSQIMVQCVDHHIDIPRLV